MKTRKVHNTRRWTARVRGRRGGTRLWAEGGRWCGVGKSRTKLLKVFSSLPAGSCWDARTFDACREGTWVSV